MATSLLAVSPHLDDAVLSIGAALGLLAQQGVHVHVATAFTADPPTELSEVAIRHHQRCKLGVHAVAERRVEDRRACKTLGATAHHIGLLDAVYRRNRQGQWACRSDDDIFSEAAPDPGLVSAVTQEVGRLVDEVAPSTVLAPLGCGGHVDHVVVRLATEQALSHHDLSLGYWADVPYALGRVLPTSPAILTMINCTEEKLKAVAEYRSQLSTLWPAGDFRRRLMHWIEVIQWLQSCPTSDLSDLRISGKL